MSGFDAVLAGIEHPLGMYHSIFDLTVLIPIRLLQDAYYIQLETLREPSSCSSGSLEDQRHRMPYRQ